MRQFVFRRPQEGAAPVCIQAVVDATSIEENLGAATWDHTGNVRTRLINERLTTLYIAAGSKPVLVPLT